MAIEWRLDLVMVFRRIGNKELATKMGMTAAEVSVLKNRARTVDFDTLSKLCEALKCEPADLLEYVPGRQEDLDVDD